MFIQGLGGAGYAGLTGAAAPAQGAAGVAARQSVAAGGALAAAEGGGAANAGAAAAADSRLAQEKALANVMNDKFNQECQTCKNRKYQDGSDDPGVSFQTPQHIDPGNAASVVASHEQEHVMREQAKAQQEGGEVLSQSVVLHGDICPECGRYYVAGGTTTTTVRHGGHNSRQDMANGEADGLDINA